jgi:hypothetical protein
MERPHLATALEIQRLSVVRGSRRDGRRSRLRALAARLTHAEGLPSRTGSTP